MNEEFGQIDASTRSCVTQAISRPQAPIRIAIADAQTLFCAGLRSLLDVEPHFQVVGEAANGSELLELLRTTETDILLLNPRLPYGETVLEELQSAGIPTKTIILTDDNDARELMVALAKGARGGLAKQSSAELLKEAIRAVHGGRVWLDALFAGGGRQRASSFGPDGGSPAAARRLWDRLTSRERQIAALFAQGWQCREISAKLSIREGTARSHLHRVYIKLRVSNREQLRASELYSQLQPVATPSEQAGASVLGRVA